MKKIVISAVIALLFIAGGVGAFLVMTNDQNTNPQNNSSNNTSDPGSQNNSDNPLSVVVNACDILTEKIVKEVFKTEVQKISTPSTSVATADNSVSSCNYITDISNSAAAEGPKLSGASLLVYAAKTPAGAASNKSQFKNKPTDVQPVEGLGDDAFYNPSFRQLHVLKGNNWYVITSYKDSIANSSLESNKELASKLNFE